MAPAFGQPLVDAVDLLGEEVHVLHGLDGQFDAAHAAHLAGPQAAGVDEVLAVDGAFLGGQVPGAVGPSGDAGYSGVAFHFGTGGLGRRRVGVGDPRGVDVAADGVPQGSHEVLLLEERDQRLGLSGGDQFGLHAQVATPSVGHTQPVHLILGVGQHQLTGLVDPAVHTCGFLEFSVQLDGVALKGGHVGVAVEGVHAACRVPGGPGGQLLAFQ